MEDINPYSSLEAPPAAFAAASERATFLKKVYGILFLGILGFAATLWAAANVPIVNTAAIKLFQITHRGMFGWLMYMGIFMGASMGVHALAEKKPLNVVAYSLYVVLLGLLIAPIVLFVAGQANGAAIISQASMITALVFGGLTFYVLYSGKDFSWLGGMLRMLFWGLLVVMVIGMFTNFSFGLWMSGACVLLFAGYILYDTSQILHRLPTTMAMSGAIMLFTDVVLLFKHILILLMNSRD
ncbi:MAG: Bax inhibitor-1 family protein [Planctomycetota bacterium]